MSFFALLCFGARVVVHPFHSDLKRGFSHVRLYRQANKRQAVNAIIESILLEGTIDDVHSGKSKGRGE